jgi:hypothetical protein
MPWRRGARVAGAIGLVALTGLALTACGVSGRLSHAEFVKQGDNLCQAANSVPAPSATRTAEGAARNARSEYSIRRKLAGKLDKLEPPSRLDAAWARYRALTDQILAGLRQEEVAARAHDAARFDQLDAQLADLQARRAQVAGELGFRVCGGAIRTPTDPALVRRLDAACTAANRVVRSVQPQLTGSLDVAAVARSGPAALVAQRRALAAVNAEASNSRTLPAAYAQFASAFAARIDLSARRVAAARAGDRSRVVVLSQRDGLVATTREAPAAQRLGFQVCGVLGQAGV